MEQKLNANDLINKSQSELNELKIIIDDNLDRLIDRGNNLNDVKQSLDDLEIIQRFVLKSVLIRNASRSNVKLILIIKNIYLLLLLL